MRASSAAERFVNVTNVQRERGPHVARQLAHEAERAGVAALLDAVEHDALELEAPVLAALALELHDARLAVEVDVAELDHIV